VPRVEADAPKGLTGAPVPTGTAPSEPLEALLDVSLTVSLSASMSNSMSVTMTESLGTLADLGSSVNWQHDGAAGGPSTSEHQAVSRERSPLHTKGEGGV
jgi:hypothetical protein